MPLNTCKTINAKIQSQHVAKKEAVVASSKRVAEGGAIIASIFAKNEVAVAA
jgi:hypothetical protein